MALDWHEVSNRINGLLKLGDAEDMRRASERLGVRQSHIEETIGRHSRLSTLKVAAAMVRVYGIDPSWLLTGTYDATTHKVGLRKVAEEIEVVLRKLLSASDQQRAAPADRIATA